MKVSLQDHVTLPSGIRLCYQTFGEPTARPLLLIMGLAGPMTWWPQDLCERLAARDFFVVRYDNRDTGLSTKLSQHRVRTADLVRAFTGRTVQAPYTISDLAADAVGLLDHLRIERAHVAGVSMGGMIAQTLAVEHRSRISSLTSIMSTTGSRRVGYQTPALLPHLLRRAARSRTEYVEGAVEFARRIGSPAYPISADAAKARAQETWDRGVDFAGVARQMLAVVSQPDRTAALGRLDLPVTVVHGLADRMVHPSGGRATARAIPGAELVLVPGMGHDLPPGLFPTLIDAIESTVRRAESAKGA